MVEDAQGFDPDLDYTTRDNPFWDCTDGAHPAWWRGQEYGCKAIVRIVNEWLDETLDEMMVGVSQPAIQALKERIHDLRTKAGI